ncbi:DNA-deoxyinosine glycosylase [Salinibius halmophilus]|uniref:DNA-deoxyinosine glycosylase n=1 Tax=Salinibius halmophilus TaxID=1853216 RepID=UPI000E6603E3|nr:DNA-deoxyinosine glycosylase [Salinibius halmophilus]
MQVNSFAPITSANSRIVILGSMPGVRSLNEGQYYAHPRNAFWPIMASLGLCSLAEDYHQRVSELTQSGVSLWDVLSHCERAGSLDSAINSKTEVANELVPWFAGMPELRLLGLNGGAAWQKYHKHFVKPGLHPPQVALVKLPSTSPAYAAMTFEQKLAKWREALASPSG